MKLGVLFSGGKDSTYAMYLEKKKENEIACLISLFSENQASYMFHTPNIKLVEKLSSLMQIPLLVKKTKGEKEKELEDLKNIILEAKKKYKIEGLVTGALHSVYQASRIKKICDDLELKCLNPLWHKNEISYLRELIENNFEIVIVGVAAYPLDKNWLGKKIDKNFVKEVEILKERYNIHPAGEGGEFETLVVNCPLFKKPLRIKSFKDYGEKNSWKREVKVE